MASANARHVRRPRLRAEVNLHEGTLAVSRALTGFVKLAPGELDDDISDLLAPRAQVHRAPVPNSMSAAGFPPASIMCDGKPSPLAVKPRTRRARKSSPAAVPAEVQAEAPATPIVLAGAAIPARISGKITIVRTLPSRNGEALIIDVAGADTAGQPIVAKNIAVWSGYAQTLVRALVQADKTATLAIRAPANDRHYPAVARVG